jgi:hypothetical protein
MMFPKSYNLHYTLAPLCLIAAYLASHSSQFTKTGCNALRRSPYKDTQHLRSRSNAERWNEIWSTRLGPVQFSDQWVGEVRVLE